MVSLSLDQKLFRVKHCLLGHIFVHPVALLSDIKQATCILEVFRQDSCHILIGQKSQILPSQNRECAYAILECQSADIMSDEWMVLGEGRDIMTGACLGQMVCLSIS